MYSFLFWDINDYISVHLFKGYTLRNMLLYKSININMRDINIY